VDALRAGFPEEIVSSGEYRGQQWVELKPGRLVEIARSLRDDPATAYRYLVDVTAVHWPDDPQPMELVYHLYSYAHDDRLRLKVRTADTGPVPSLSTVFKAAEWNERETYDMFGIRFEHHPDLRRILMPDDYTDFPLRKELPLFRG
jgi:NADH-quinone oxidoreductase subunit C